MQGYAGIHQEAEHQRLNQAYSSCTEYLSPYVDIVGGITTLLLHPWSSQQCLLPASQPRYQQQAFYG